ncbi:N-methyltransferase [Plasmopara halstedii]|uniref:N-methyltransferase n=1 Tax=Plasmopara halstedii TaxID=4781 RepID=A0A0P1AFC5_PLAHL|nr:N-methyltransferase [Plasmopara halstedii]CEG39488.1 N-methyltransferase [Plasmopara halstedii]|eukprot:XP_024575857.1 N-methyltransferase [Plasmopara halstedii]
MTTEGERVLKDTFSNFDALVGYNEWATETLDVHIATDFVYETQDGACATERGVFIAEDVPPHTEVFSIPLDSVFTVKSLQKNAPFKSIAFFQQFMPEREDEQLAIALLYEKFVRGDKSKWAKHIDLLPTTYYNALYFEPEVLKALEGSNLFFIALHIKEKVVADYTRLRDSVILELFDKITESVNVDLEESFSLKNYKWAISTIWSRFVSLQLNDTWGEQTEDIMKKGNISRQIKQSFKAMVPVFDMLNHDPEAEMSHFVDKTLERFCLVSHQHWVAGSQMFINYGPLSNHKLLTLYGFVIIDNPFDAVEMWLPMDAASTRYFEKKQQLLLSNGLDHATNPFELVADEVNDLLLIAARLQEIDCETLELFVALANKALNGEIVSLENEQQVLIRLICTLESMLEAFPTSIDEDDELSMSWNNDLGNKQNNRFNHERMAICIRRSEKFILSENLNMFKWKLLNMLPRCQ